MTYADAVTKEVLRITPPAGAIFRRTTVDLEVRNVSQCGSAGAEPLTYWCGTYRLF